MKKNKKKLTNIIATTIIGISITIIIFITMFFQKELYNHGYEKNGAYKELGKEKTTNIANNWINYLKGKEELKNFEGEQKKHLEEVKEIIKKTTTIALILLITGITIITINKTTTKKIMINTGTSIIIISIILIILGLNWNWFFTKIHEALFTTKWLYNEKELIITLWGGRFFQEAYITGITRTITTGIMLIIIGKTLSDEASNP